jgi:hypothetical protein
VTENLAEKKQELAILLRRDRRAGAEYLKLGHYPQLGLSLLAKRLSNIGGDPGNYRGMVCSFITSTEYQRRFSLVVTRANGECGR